MILTQVCQFFQLFFPFKRLTEAIQNSLKPKKSGSNKPVIHFTVLGVIDVAVVSSLIPLYLTNFIINHAAGPVLDPAEDELTMTDWAQRFNDLRYPALHNPAQTDGPPVENLVPRPLDVDKVLQPSEEHAAIPWEQFLGAGSDAPKLSFAKTENEFLDSGGSSGLVIDRKWDVDSFIARVTNFHAYRFGFRLSYTPSFLSRETQTQHVTLDGGCKVDQCKNLCLGTGLLAAGTFRTYVVFRHMSTKQTGTCLTDEEQQIWIDDIVIPALRHAFGADVAQHHVRSFAAARRKSRVLQEKHPNGSQESITLHGVLPEEGLADFSAHLEDQIRDCIQRRPARYTPYKDPLFVIAGHDLKCITKSSTLAQLQTKFTALLEACFRFTPEYFPESDCWLDVGAEDTADDVSCGEPGQLIVYRLQGLLADPVLE